LKSYAFFVFWGKASKIHAPQILLVRNAEDMKGYFARFLSGDIDGLDKLFSEKGLPPEKFYRQLANQ
jgi:hypothetical protein